MITYKKVNCSYCHRIYEVNNRVFISQLISRLIDQMLKMSCPNCFIRMYSEYVNKCSLYEILKYDYNLNDDYIIAILL